MTIMSDSREHTEYAVRLYESDAFLAAAVCRFIADGLAVGEPAIVIATNAHLTVFTDHLGAAWTGARS